MLIDNLKMSYIGNHTYLYSFYCITVDVNYNQYTNFTKTRQHYYLTHCYFHKAFVWIQCTLTGTLHH